MQAPQIMLLGRLHFQKQLLEVSAVFLLSELRIDWEMAKNIQCFQELLSD